MLNIVPASNVITGTIISITAGYFMVRTYDNKTIAVAYQEGYRVGDTVHVTQQGNTFYIISKIANAARVGPKKIYLTM